MTLMDPTQRRRETEDTEQYILNTGFNMIQIPSYKKSLRLCDSALYLFWFDIAVNQHRIAIAEESILVRHRMAIRGHHRFVTTEGAD